jgi:hypothetical protein
MWNILELDDPEWTSRLSSLPRHQQDVHFFPNLLAPYQAFYGWAAKAALTTRGDDFLIQPFLFTHDGQIRHAYNLGGPIGTAPELWSEHEQGLIEWGLCCAVASSTFAVIRNLEVELAWREYKRGRA